MSQNNPDQLENQQDEDEEKKRPVLLIPIVIIALLITIGTSYAVVRTVIAPEVNATPTRRPTATEAEVAEVIETEETGEAATSVNVSTEEATEESTAETEEPTDEPTDQATEEPTDEPTDEPADTPTPRVGTPRPPATPDLCGNGICDPNETPTTCADDCATATTPAGGTCGTACTTSATCAPGLSCFGGVCWNASVCEDTTPEPPTPTPTVQVNCSCNGEFLECSNGTSTISNSCIEQACSCVDITGVKGDAALNSAANLQTCTETATFDCSSGNSYTIDYACGTAPASCYPTQPTCACEGNGSPMMVCDDGTSFADDSCIIAHCSCSGWSGGEPTQEPGSEQASFCQDPNQPGTAFYFCPADNGFYGISSTCGAAELNGCFGGADR